MEIRGEPSVSTAHLRKHPGGTPPPCTPAHHGRRWALGDSKRPDVEPLRFTTEELDAAGIDPARFGLGA
ncbi:DUF397 domain-containing protein [Streptomyces albogriseolus]|uniref:DUF397 domain-containing protein n=1 Tax=Streptomyces albogriseolus TaxID=1887 RepID=UPI0036FE0EAD